MRRRTLTLGEVVARLLTNTLIRRRDLVCADLLQSVLSDLRDKVAEIERDRWMYEENSEYNAF